MKREKSCGAVIIHKSDRGPEFLAIQSKTHGHWGFPKGHMEAGETELEAAVREVREETGLTIAVLKDFRTTTEYQPAEDVFKEVVFFMAIVPDKKVTIQAEEIMAYQWTLYDEMLKLLTFDVDKRVLREAYQFIHLNQLMN